MQLPLLWRKPILRLVKTYKCYFYIRTYWTLTKAVAYQENRLIIDINALDSASCNA